MRRPELCRSHSEKARCVCRPSRAFFKRAGLSSAAVSTSGDRFFVIALPSGSVNGRVHPRKGSRQSSVSTSCQRSPESEQLLQGPGSQERGRRHHSIADKARLETPARGQSIHEHGIKHPILIRNRKMRGGLFACHISFSPLVCPAADPLGRGEASARVASRDPCYSLVQ